MSGKMEGEVELSGRGKALKGCVSEQSFNQYLFDLTGSRHPVNLDHSQGGCRLSGPASRKTLSN